MNSKEKGKFGALFLTVIITGILVLLTIIFIIFAKYLGPQINFASLFFNKTYELTNASPNLPISKKIYETIDISQITELRSMLREERFEELNTVLASYQTLFENDQTNEYKVYDAYVAFYLTLPAYEDFLKKWIDATPDTYQPYLAMAQYYYAKGWESRGYEVGKDISEAKLEKMRAFFSKSENNINTALKINPNLMVAYKILLGILNLNENVMAEDEIIRKTSKLFPYSFLMRYTHLWVKQPRWGGTYELMEEIAKDAERYAERNPKLSVLYGFICADQARMVQQNKEYDGIFELADELLSWLSDKKYVEKFQQDKYKKALELYEKALAFGDYWSFYNERAMIYLYHLKKYDFALENINRSIALRPIIHENYLVRSTTYFFKRMYADSFTDLHTAEMINPVEPRMQKWRDWASRNFLKMGHGQFSTDIRKALEYYDLSIEFDENNSEAYYWRGVAYIRLEDYDSALSDFETAVERESHHFKSYRMIAYLLSRDQQWEEIISYWNDFLELEPNYAEAYFERANAYYHHKEIENAITDLKKACRLGSEDGCDRYDMIKRQ